MKVSLVSNQISERMYLVVRQIVGLHIRELRGIDHVEAPGAEDLDASLLHLLEGGVDILLSLQEREPVGVGANKVLDTMNTVSDEDEEDACTCRCRAGETYQAITVNLELSVVDIRKALGGLGFGSSSYAKRKSSHSEQARKYAHRVILQRRVQWLRS
jgi:hypothetical protein